MLDFQRTFWSTSTQLRIQNVIFGQKLFKSKKKLVFLLLFSEVVVGVGSTQRSHKFKLISIENCAHAQNWISWWRETQYPFDAAWHIHVPSRRHRFSTDLVQIKLSNLQVGLTYLSLHLPSFPAHTCYHVVVITSRNRRYVSPTFCCFQNIISKLDCHCWRQMLSTASTSLSASSATSSAEISATRCWFQNSVSHKTVLFVSRSWFDRGSDPCFDTSGTPTFLAERGRRLEGLTVIREGWQA